MIICGLCAQGMHAIIMTNFPYVEFLSFPFVGAIIMLLLNHYLAFEFFTQNYFSFSEVSIWNILTVEFGLNNLLSVFYDGTDFRVFYNLPVDPSICTFRITECERQCAAHYK